MGHRQGGSREVVEAEREASWAGVQLLTNKETKSWIDDALDRRRDKQICQFPILKTLVKSEDRGESGELRPRPAREAQGSRNGDDNRS